MLLACLFSFAIQKIYYKIFEKLWEKLNGRNIG